MIGHAIRFTVDENTFGVVSRINHIEDEGRFNACCVIEIGSGVDTQMSIVWRIDLHVSLDARFNEYLDIQTGVAKYGC
jgi:hypothetical protein